ncbi:MAG: cupin domain-containing protein [Chloroflexia bacterium]|nr:cupin domain-containing protein [Chloroflexia bacterium]
MVVSDGVYSAFNLDDEIARFPPDPETEARHRAETLLKTETLRVVLITMLTGGHMHAQDAPGALTIHVLRGALRLQAAERTAELGTGEIIALAPGVRYAIEGAEDGAFLLTIADLTHEPNRGGPNGGTRAEERGPR